jgi:WD40 repeat protein
VQVGLRSANAWSTVELRRAADGSVLRVLKAFGVTTIAFSPDRQLLATGDSDVLIRLWRVSDGTLLYTLRTPPKPLASLKGINTTV